MFKHRAPPTPDAHTHTCGDQRFRLNVHLESGQWDSYIVEFASACILILRLFVKYHIQEHPSNIVASQASVRVLCFKMPWVVVANRTLANKTFNVISVQERLNVFSPSSKNQILHHQLIWLKLVPVPEPEHFHQV